MGKYTPQVNGSTFFILDGKVYYMTSNGIKLATPSQSKDIIEKNSPSTIQPSDVENLFKQIVGGYKRYNNYDFVNETGYGPSLVKSKDAPTYLQGSKVSLIPTRSEELALRPDLIAVEKETANVNTASPNTASANKENAPKPSGINLITSTLNLGSQGEQVKALQQYLAGIGYKNADGTPLKADGIYGPMTKTAVMQFQSKNGLTPDGIFGPKSLAKTQQLTSTNMQADSAAPGSINSGIKPPDHPSNQFNTQTGEPNPNYNPNANGNSFNTGDTAQDALLKELQSFIKAQQDAGLKLNAALNFDQATLDKFLETAKRQIHPFYQTQIDNIKADVLRTAPQILKNYGNDVEKEKANFENTLGTSRENYAGSGLAFSGQRAKGELGMETQQNRNLQELLQGYGNKLYELGRGAEEKIGAGNMQGYNLGALANYSANLSGNGGFKLNGSSNPYTSGGYQIGSLQNDEAAAQEARRQALIKSASESVVAGRSYNDLFA